MMYLYILLYISNILAAGYAVARFPHRVSFFSPWPGFTLMFSTFLLVGTLSLRSPVSELQWGLYSLALVGFSAGCGTILLIKSRRSRRLGAALHTTPAEKIQYFNQTFNNRILFSFALIATLATAYLWSQSGAPLLAQNVDSARAAYLSNGYIAILGALLDVSAVFAFAYMCSTKRERKDYGFFVAAVIVILFVIVAILAGSRTRLLKVIIPCVFIYNYFVRPIKVREFVLAFVLGVIFIGGIGYYRSFSLYGLNLAEGIGSDAGNWSLPDYVLFFAKRELSTAAYGLDLVLKHIPNSTPHTNGLLHVGPFLSPFQIKVPIPGDFFKAMVGGTWYGFGLAATFIAPMYADFSWWGVLGMSFVYALLISTAYSNIRSPSRSSAYWVPIYGMLLFFMISGMRSDMVSFELIWFLLVGYSFKLLRKRTRPRPASMRHGSLIVPRAR